MSAESVTIRERLLLHLGRFPEQTPDEIYNVPFDLTQDGIASVLGISRAHTSLELKKLRESGKVTEWLAHIRASGTKRKAYCLLPEGVREAASLRSRLTTEGISVESLLDMKRCDPEVMWNALSPEDRDTFGFACIFREPVPRSTLPPTSTGVIPADFTGMTAISAEVGKKYLGLAGDEDARAWHSRAADWYLENGGDAHERLFHLCSSGRHLEASRHLIRNADVFLENPNEDLLQTIGRIAVSPKYDENVLDIRADVAIHCLDTEDARHCAERLDEYRSVKAVVVRAEADIIDGRAETALADASAAYAEHRTPSLALVKAKALFSLQRFDEAEMFLTEAIGRFMEAGDVGRMDEIMILRAGVAFNRGRDDECLSYLGKALRSCRSDSRRSKVASLASRVGEDDRTVTFL